MKVENIFSILNSFYDNIYNRYYDDFNHRLWDVMKVLFNPKVAKTKYLSLCESLNTLSKSEIKNYKISIFRKFIRANTERIYTMKHYGAYIDLNSLIRNNQLEKLKKVSTNLTMKDIFPPLNDVH